jgi:hypothetical protein
MPSGPGKAGEMLYRYRLFGTDGSDQGEAHYAVTIDAGDEVRTGDGRKLRVVGFVPVPDDDSPYMGFLTVETA